MTAPELADIDRAHACPGRTCHRDAPLPPEMLMCNPCWHRLTRPARRRVYVAFAAVKREPSTDHKAWLRRAQAAAIAELRKTEVSAT